MKAAVLFLSLTSMAILGAVPISKDLGFRYKDGVCVNSKGEKGLNPGYIGQCGDLAGVKLANLDLDGTDFSGARFINADLQLSTLNDAVLVGVDFEGARLSGLELNGAKIHNTSFRSAVLKNIKLADADIRGSNFSKVDFGGTALSYVRFESCAFEESKFIDGTLDGVEFIKSKLLKANFSGANLQDANLEEAVLDGADFTGANLTRASLRSAKGEGLSFSGAVLREANLQSAVMKGANLKSVRMEKSDLGQANLEKADLRSANLEGVRTDGTKFTQVVFNKRTTLPFARDEAERLGMIFKMTSSVLIIWDQKTAMLDALVKALTDADMEITLTPEREDKFAGMKGLEEFKAVIHLDGVTFDQDMPEAGQKALVAYVQAGGTFLQTEWNSYEISGGRLKLMRDLSLYNFEFGGEGERKFKPVEKQAKHPVLEGITAEITVNAGYTSGGIFAFKENPSTVLMQDAGGKPMVATRNFGKGKVVGFAFAGNYGGENCLADSDVHKLFINSINWD